MRAVVHAPALDLHDEAALVLQLRERAAGQFGEVFLRIEPLPRGAGFAESLRVADDLLRQAVQGISDIITTPGLINRDFSDIRAIMTGMGYAMMGTATAAGKDACVEAAQKAITIIEGLTKDDIRRFAEMVVTMQRNLDRASGERNSWAIARTEKLARRWRANQNDAK